MDKMSELNDLLFRQIERLSSEKLTKDQLDTEIERSKAMALVASQYISNETLQLRKAVLLGGNSGAKFLGKKTDVV